MNFRIVTKYGYIVTGEASEVNDIPHLLAISGDAVYLKNDGKDIRITKSEISVIEEI